MKKQNARPKQNQKLKQKLRKGKRPVRVNKFKPTANLSPEIMEMIKGMSPATNSSIPPDLRAKLEEMRAQRHEPIEVEDIVEED